MFYGGGRMLIGVMSDTHDNLNLVDKAVSKLNDEGVELVLHAGDYVSPFVIPKFSALTARLIGVYGNNDGDHQMLRQRFEEARNCEIRGRFAEVNVENYRVALLHGDETALLNVLLKCNYFDAVVHGHTHNACIERVGKTLVVNPGEVCGYLTSKPTVAVLDTVKAEARIVQL
jgi:putative phosphoesterase